MAGSVNKVILVGNVGKDPEIRNTQNGGKIVNLTLATSETWNDKASGERKERTEWHRIVIFNEKLGDVAEKYVTKGTKLYVEGSLQTRKWTDQSGQEKYTTEIVLQAFNGTIQILTSKAESQSQGTRQPDRTSQQNAYSAPAKSNDPFADLDDEIPF